MNLVLIGYRGTGKSTLSDLLHHQLDMPVYHMDEMLEERLEEKISSFVARCGWQSFREEERLLVEELTELDDIILDTGGGVVLREDNVRDLKKNGFVVWLQTSEERIRQRIGKDRNRPPLTGGKTTEQEITEVLNERLPLYQQTADFTVNTDADSMDECINQIVGAWKKHHETLETS